MTFTGKLKSSLVDTGLIVGLMLAVGGVYSVETRLPRTNVDQAKEGYEEKVEIETGLSGTTKRTHLRPANEKRQGEMDRPVRRLRRDRGMRAGRA